MKIKIRNRMKVIAFVIAVCSLSVIGLNWYKDINAATTGPVITFTPGTDMLTVKNGTVGYYFYTTTNASKKVPAAQKWVKTNAGAVDVSSFTSGKTLYFAMSTTPQLSEIITVQIPASPVLSKATYNETRTDLGSKFTFYMKVKVSTVVKEKTITKVQDILVPQSRIEVKVNDNSSWLPFDKAITASTLPGLQKEGATIYARIAPSTKVDAVNVNGIYALKDSGSTAIKSTEQEVAYSDTETVVRYGVAKQLKINKVAGGPDVKIDYANHCMTIKKGQAYGTSNTTYGEPTSFTAVTDKATEKKYFGINGTVKTAECYGVKTTATNRAADSLTTFIMIPATKAFADTGSTVSVQGGYEETARMTIVSSEAVKNISYQYAIVDLSNTDLYKDLITSTGEFDYSNTNVKWITIKTNASGVASAMLQWNRVSDKQIIVRKAAEGTTYSSAVEILNAPTGTDTPSYTAGAACDAWGKLTQALYKTGFIYTNKNIRYGINFSNPTFDATTNKITFFVYGGNVNDVEAAKLKVGKEEYQLSSDFATKTDISVKSGSTVLIYNTKVIIDLSKISDIPKSNSNTINIVFPEAYAKDTSGIMSFENTESMKVDNKAPKLLTAIVKKDTSDINTGNIVLTFDSKLSLNGTALESDSKISADNFTVVASPDKKYMAKISEATYSYSSKTKKVTVTIPYTIINSTYASYTVKFKAKVFTDVVGNILEDTEFSVDNPTYKE